MGEFLGVLAVWAYFATSLLVIAGGLFWAQADTEDWIETLVWGIPVMVVMIFPTIGCAEALALLAAKVAGGHELLASLLRLLFASIPFLGFPVMIGYPIFAKMKKGMTAKRERAEKRAAIKVKVAPIPRFDPDTVLFDGKRAPRKKRARRYPGGPGSVIGGGLPPKATSATIRKLGKR